MRKQISCVIVVLLLVATGLTLFSGTTSAASKIWTSDVDFAGGVFAQTEVIGTGAAASIKLQTDPMHDWIQKTPSASPTPRISHSMVFDERNEVVIMFGGTRPGSILLNETWRYSTVTNMWTNITTLGSPSPRINAGFSYDPVQEVAVLYGGQDAGGPLNDVWEFNVITGTWAPISPPPPRPRPTTDSPLSYDINGGVHIMVGYEPIVAAMITWAYDAATNTWTDLNPPSGPTDRERFTLTYDRAVNRTVLFGGAFGLTVHGDVWEYDRVANTWTQTAVHIPNVTPNPRYDHAMKFGPMGAVSLMYGGVDDSGAYPPETWYFVAPATLWIQPSGIVSPPARRQHEFAWDSVRDITVMFGGLLSDGSTFVNETWWYATGYYNAGDYQSPVFDSTCADPDYVDLWWNDTKPPLTNVRFKFASSDNIAGPWNYLGPDGLPGTFYTTPGTAIHTSHDTLQYSRWRAYFTTSDPGATPLLDDVTLNYDCAADPPEIINTDPADMDTGVLLDADIIVTFSEPMNTGTVTWTFTGPGLSGSWNSPTNTILTLTPASLLLECTWYTVQITAGRDANDDLDLVPGPVPNPWTFQTVCINPYITITDPADGEADVPVNKIIDVTFSEPMNTTTVAWSLIGLSAPILSPTWNGARTVLSLSPATDYIECEYYTMEITQGKDDQDLDLVAGPVPNPWTFRAFCPNPFIVSTTPADNDIDVLLNANIIVEFSQAMNVTSVTWWFSDPGITFLDSWNSPTNTILTLSHVIDFTESTTYMVEITGGLSAAGFPLVPSMTPNPWNFTTIGINPFITNTDPYDTETSVPLDTDINVTFSEPMNTVTVSWSFTGPALTPSWDGTRTVLTLTLAAPLFTCTNYTVEILTGDDDFGNPLGPGPVPNPWTFTAYCPLTGPANLRAVISVDDVILTWDPLPGSVYYNVYESQDRFATFPSSWNLLGSPMSSPYTAVGHGTDGLTHFYIVRAFDGIGESPNSTMAVKKTFSFTQSPVNSNIQWFSLPYVSDYLLASDIASELGPTKIDVIGKWDPTIQRAIVYYYARGQWRGTDFTISAGDGLYLSIRQSFEWNITGIDADVMLTFTPNPAPLGNIFWTGIPYTGNYSKASDIANELTESKIHEVGLWNPATQTSFRWYWTGTLWTGVDFTFEPGAGIYLIIISSFTWNPILMTPTVP